MSQEIIQCDGCGLESDQKDIFHFVSHFFSKKSRTLCPVCFGDKDGKVYLALLLGYVVLLLTALLLGEFFPSMSLGPWLLNIAMLQFFVFICTIAHELGHVWAGRLADFRIFDIEIGQGRVIYQFSFRGLRWHFKSFPFGGCVHGTPRNTKYYKSRMSLFVLGGPLANAALIAVCIWTWPQDATIHSGILRGSEPAMMFLLSNASLLLYSLWPHHIESRDGKSPNDMLLLWETLRRPQDHIKQMPAYWYFKESQESQREGRYEEARKWIEDGLKLFPQNYYLEWAQPYNLQDLKKYQEARKTYVRLLGRYSKLEELRFTIFNNIAYGDMLTGDPQLLDEAEVCSRVALEKYPSNPYFVGTRGCVLIELGQYEEGLKLLYRALKSQTDRLGQALNACYIAIAEARRAKLDESRNFFAMARRLDPKCFLLERENHEIKK